MDRRIAMRRYMKIEQRLKIHFEHVQTEVDLKKLKNLKTAKSEEVGRSKHLRVTYIYLYLC